MFFFLLDYLHFSKLLKLHQTEGRISSNLLKRKQSRKTSIVCRWLYTQLDCDPLGATNASKHSINQSEDRILQINNQKMIRSAKWTAALIGLSQHRNNT